MKKILSFEKDHDALQPGLHARKDNNQITTFDPRFKKPNAGNHLGHGLAGAKEELKQYLAILNEIG